MIFSKVISDDTYSNKSWCMAGQGTFYLMEINQMECKVCSYLEWQLNVELTALQDFGTMIGKGFGDSGPYLALYALPAPSPGSPTHPGPRVNSIQVATPSFRPNAAPFPPSTTSSIRLGERGSSISSYPAQTNGTYLPTPPVLHSDVSPCNLMSPVTPQDTSHSDTKIMSSAGLNTMQISGNSYLHNSITLCQPTTMDTPSKKMLRVEVQLMTTIYAFAQ